MKEHGGNLTKSTFHLEESQFRSSDVITVQLSVRPKSYAEFCTYQSNKISQLERVITEMREKEDNANDDNSDSEEEKKYEDEAQPLTGDEDAEEDKYDYYMPIYPSVSVS